MNNKVVKIITKKKEYYILLLYLTLGILFFTIRYEGESYLHMYIDSGFDKQFLVLFFYPCIVYLTSIIIKYINSDYTYLLRVNDRKAYVKISIKNMIIMLLIFYFHYLILKLISINMVNHANLNIYSIYNKNFQFNTLLLSIILSVRMLLNIILLSIFTYTILIKNKNTNLVWIFVLIIFVYYGDYYYPINKVIAEEYPNTL